MAQFLLNALTLSNIKWFSKCFHCQNQENICNNIITKDPTSQQLAKISLTLLHDGWQAVRPLDKVRDLGSYSRQRTDEWRCCTQLLYQLPQLYVLYADRWFLTPDAHSSVTAFNVNRVDYYNESRHTAPDGYECCCSSGRQCCQVPAHHIHFPRRPHSSQYKTTLITFNCIYVALDLSYRTSTMTVFQGLTLSGRASHVLS